MRTIRILMVPAAALLFSGAILALPGCGGTDDTPISINIEEAKAEGQARADYAKTEKKAPVHKFGVGSDPRG
ncbi:hypothetical protein [Paludisphaera rhizosphaerae]|uniref:hypothetical protein n=1 Tax=Paludisphaera rhizosphaerae TaxID=2711216 RepID=UPI0013EA2D26|nr:hypothetical protein [Paludisphaera rhizosphaerae]